MGFADLEDRVNAVVLDRISNVQVSINGAASVSGIFDEPAGHPFEAADAAYPTVEIDAGVAVERGDAVTIDGARIFRVIGLEPAGGFTRLRLSA